MVSKAKTMHAWRRIQLVCISLVLKNEAEGCGLVVDGTRSLLQGLHADDYPTGRNLSGDSGNGAIDDDDDVGAAETGGGSVAGLIVLVIVGLTWYYCCCLKNKESDPSKNPSGEEHIELGNNSREEENRRRKEEERQRLEDGSKCGFEVICGEFGSVNRRTSRLPGQ